MERWYRVGLVGVFALILVTVAACSQGSASGASGSSLKVAGKDIAFDQTQLTAAANQPITVNFSNTGSLVHSIVFDLPPANDKAGDVGVPAGWETGQGVAAGQSATLNLPALQPGQYRYYCAVPGHAEAGMVGTLTVK
ncbi:MAG: cupredoxin domain-containing protein [Anaerolineae bacterium]